MRNKHGFTLVEMLIVIAIVAVLIAISVPMLSNALEKSREAKDASNIRSAMAELVQAAMLEDISVAKGITYSKSGGYYQKIVYCTQKTPKWQSGNKSGKLVMNGVEIGASSYSKVPPFWYVRYYAKGEKEGTFAVPVKSNK